MPLQTVVTYFSRLGTPMLAHEKETLAAVARSIAALKRTTFGGLHGAGAPGGALFFVPDDTLMPDEAADLGILGAEALFGAVAPYPFVKTKAISHGLVAAGADRPEGWSAAFARKVRNAVLPGCTVFSRRDARAAAERLLPRHEIRLKKPLACGGRDQTIVTSIRDLDACLDRYPADTLAAYGVVLEANLRRVTTLSVGQVTLGDAVMTYHGVQRTTTDNEGQPTYGGSDLFCVRGDWDALDRLPLTSETRLAVSQARSYDRAAGEYRGFFGSRRNYDVAQGIDGRGEFRSGVLEASWRSGGASTAELAALTAFALEPGLQAVEACAVKQFGRDHRAPRHAVIHFCGDDPDDGPILRYTSVTRPLRQAA